MNKSLLTPNSILTFALAATTLQGVQPPQCSVRYETIYVRQVADLPQQIQSDLLQGGAIADPDQPFEASDEIADPDLPTRRLMLAGRSRNGWFVWIDHGGYARHADVFGYRQLWSRPDSFVWYRSAALQGDPCIAINAFLDGVSTPTSPEH